MKGNFRIAIWSAIALLVGSVLHGAEHGKIQIYDDVEYMITTPSGCTWMLARTAVDASQFHGFRDDCNTTAFSTGVSQSRLFTYIGKLSIHRMINTTDCCIEVEVDHSSGWVARDLLDVAPEGRAVYDTHVAEERAKAEEERAKAEEEARKEAKKEAAEAGRRKKLAAERKKNEAEEAARLAKIKSERDARALEELSKVVEACGKIYHSTIDKKRGDLTVREEEQVKLCQSLHLYPPQ